MNCGAIVGAYDIAAFATCFDFLQYRAWTNDCVETRTKTFSVIKIAYATFTNYDNFSNKTAGLWTGIKEYTIETASTSNQARYNQGKIIFNVASLFIGVGEANAILKGEKTLATVLKESVAAYKQLPKSLAKLITKTGSKLKTKVIKGVSGLSLMYQLNTAEIKLGTIINQGGKAIVKIEVPMTKGTVLETIEECLYLNADNVVSKATIEVLEDGGKVGLGLQGAGNILDDIVLTMKADFPSTWKFNKIGDDAFEVLDGAGKKWGTVYKDKIVCPARTQIGTAGNPILNKSTLVKNMKYEVDDIIYQTDELGRVLKTNADLDDITRVRLGNQQIRAVDIKDGVRGVDQGGHIVGSRFFGPGEQINLYPQSANLNQGAWKTMENSWADAMVQGKDVKIEVEAIFSGASKRPDSFKVKYTIDGQPFQENFINQ